MFWKSNDKRFAELFQEHIANSTQAAKELAQFFGNLKEAHLRTDRIIEHEHHGDDLAREIHELLDRTFITKIDKTDIAELANELDHIIDFMRATVVRVRIYRITENRAEAGEFAAVIIGMTEILQELIRDVLKPRAETVKQAVVKLKELEEEGDLILHRALERLFAQEQDMRRVVQWQDIFEKLEMVTDHCEDVGNVVSSISRKESS